MRIENGELVLEPGERAIQPDMLVRVEGDDPPHPVGRQCVDCGDICFPPFRHFLKCNAEKETMEKALSTEATLVSYAISRQVMPGFQPKTISSVPRTSPR